MAGDVIVAMSLQTMILWSLFRVIYSGGDINVAVGKMAYQTDTASDGVASRAVDGYLSGYYTDRSCTHTLSNDVVWEVDLGSIYSISTVTIFNRYDCCSDRLQNVQLFIGPSRSTYMLRGYQAGAAGLSLSFKFPGYVNGRWVKIGRLNITNAQLTLCEVQVFGHVVPKVIFSTDVSQQVATGNVIRSAQSQNEMQCCYACLKTGICLAANYNNSSKVCTLYDTTTSFSASIDSILIQPYY